MLQQLTDYLIYRPSKLDEWSMSGMSDVAIPIAIAGMNKSEL